MNQVRAKKGGEIGVNGEWYEGGKFLPSTEMPKKQKTRNGFKMSERQLVAPGEFAIAPEPGMRSIFQAISVFVGVSNGVMEITASEHTLNYYGYGGENCELQTAVKKWNSGVRFTNV